MLKKKKRNFFVISIVWKQAEQEAAEVKKQNPEESEIQAVVRPSQDVFTAIFCSDAPLSQVLAEQAAPLKRQVDPSRPRGSGRNLPSSAGEPKTDPREPDPWRTRG